MIISGNRNSQRVVRVIQGVMLVFNKVEMDALAPLLEVGIDLNNIQQGDMPVFIPVMADLITDAAKGAGKYAPNVVVDSFQAWADQNMPDKYELMHEIMTHHPLDSDWDKEDVEDEETGYSEFIQNKLNQHYDYNRPKNTVFVRDIPFGEMTKLFAAIISIGSNKGKG